MTRSVLTHCLLLFAILSASGCGSYEAISETVKRVSKGGVSVDDAKVALREGDLIGAERVLRERVKFDPQNKEARLLLANVYRGLANESGLFPDTEPPASMEQLELVAAQDPKNLAVAERIMAAHLGARRMEDARSWAIIVARLDKQHPLAHQLITDALADAKNWKMMSPLTTRLSRIPQVRPLVIVNAAVRLGRGLNALPEYEVFVMRYLKLTSAQTHLQWESLPEEDIPRLMTVLLAAIELGEDVAQREDRLSQTLTIVSRLIKVVRPEVVPWILAREAEILLKADELNQGDLMAEMLSGSVEAQLLRNRVRFVETATRLPEDMTLDEETQENVRELQARLSWAKR
ncbi:MAG: hypothetical protein H8E37_13685 [Planctomycetes bacterium]|nr:hypothetical protein [Planctomycetota bacterium]